MEVDKLDVFRFITDQWEDGRIDPIVNKLQVVKLVKERFDIGLKEAKDFVDAFQASIYEPAYKIAESEIESGIEHIEEILRDAKMIIKKNLR
jgi:ribosomal protein L7/L12